MKSKSLHRTELGKALEKKNMTIYALAKAVGCAYPTAFRWVIGKYKPNQTFQKKIDKLLLTVT